MRTSLEILARLKDRQPHDPLGFEWQEYLRALSKQDAESLRGTLIKSDADLSDWEPDLNSDDAIRKCCVDYMEFAWEKANNCRGISAGRSMMHYKAWLWMLGQDSFEDIENYNFYGKDNLIRICRFLDLDLSKWDDGQRRNRE